ncbi:MAG: nucleoside-diphosphate sugar epimerase [candidate division Zixibacteria bacterium SM23_73]|nr:MAG: nucleoside-diphosphate sugar epimerase [candidate division Zixibacteria bacterium SM23_73]
MRVLITGGAGFIGSRLAERLLEKGDEVYGIDNFSTGRLDNIQHLLSESKFHLTVGTILNEKTVEPLVKTCDRIFHLAAAVGVRLIIERPVDTIETNILGTEIVLRLANKYKRKVLIASTSEVYGKGNHVPFSEEDDRTYGPTVKSRWSYATSKAVDEFLTLAYFHEKKLPVVIARLFNTIGPRQTGSYGMVVPSFVQQTLLGHPITVYGDGEQTRCFTYVDDVVSALLQLMEHPQAVGEVFNVGNSEEISINDLAALVKKLVGGNSEIIHIPYEEAFEKGFEDMQRRVPDTTKIKKLIGFKPTVSLEESIKRIIEYYRK